MHCFGWGLAANNGVSLCVGGDIVSIVTVGELSLDDVVREEEGCVWNQPGGGALYSAVGALLWHEDVGISAVVGVDYPDEIVESIANLGIDTRGIERVSELGTLGLWLLYEAHGHRHQLVKAYGPSFGELDCLRKHWSHWYPEADAVHVAPQTSQGQLRSLALGKQSVTTLDLLIEPFIDVTPYLDGSALRGVDYFLPSEQELKQLWNDVDGDALRVRLGALGYRGGLVVKRGQKGVEIIDERSRVVIPTVAGIESIDDTGAGDAFCGGFIAGMLEFGDPVRAAAYGVVSSSFIIESHSALSAGVRLNHCEARRRLLSVEAQAERIYP